MNSIFEELYHGNIRPDARFYRPDSPFAEAANIKHSIREKLNATLKSSEKELFEKYCEAQAEIEDIVNYDTFVYGLKFGILLMAETFTAS